MILEDTLKQIFRDWGQELNFQEREALKKKAMKCSSVEAWRWWLLESLIDAAHQYHSNP